MANILVVDYGSFVLPFDYELIRGLEKANHQTSFVGSRTIYQDDELDNISNILGDRSKLFSISQTSGTFFKQIFQLLKLLLFVVSKRNQFKFVIVTFPRLLVFDIILRIICREKILFVVHNLWPHSHKKKITFHVRLLAFFSRTIVVCSPFVEREIKKIPNLGNTRIVLLQLGLLDIGNLVDYESDCCNPDKIMMIGRLKPYKGTQTLLRLLESRILERLNVELIIRGPLSQISVREKMLLIEQCHVEDGELSNKEILKVFSEQPIFILPYDFIFQSGFFYLLLNYECICICSDVGDFGDFYRRHNLEELLFDPQNLCSIEKSIRFAQNNRAHIKMKLSVIKKGYQWDETLKPLLRHFSS